MIILLLYYLFTLAATVFAFDNGFINQIEVIYYLVSMQTIGITLYSMVRIFSLNRSKDSN